jgi:hypothetical protein
LIPIDKANMGYEDCCVCGKTFSDTVREAFFCVECEGVICRSKHCRQVARKYPLAEEDYNDVELCLASCPNCDEKAKEENKEEKKEAHAKVLALVKSFNAMELLALKEIISEGIDCEERGYGCDYEGNKNEGKEESKEPQVKKSEAKKTKKQKKRDETIRFVSNFDVKKVDVKKTKKQKAMEKEDRAHKQADVERQVAYELYLQQNRT